MSASAAAYSDSDDPEALVPTESTPLTGEGTFALAAATSPTHYAHGRGSGQGEPPDRQLSQSDADADRIGEELLGVSGGEDAVHEWIKKSLNLLPPLRESRVYDEQQGQLGESADVESEGGDLTDHIRHRPGGKSLLRRRDIPRSAEECDVCKP